MALSGVEAHMFNINGTVCVRVVHIRKPCLLQLLKQLILKEAAEASLSS